MTDFTSDCYKQVSSLLGENKVVKAFQKLDELIEKGDYLEDEDFREVYVLCFSRYKRIEHHFKLGNIPWDTYDITSTKIISSTLSLAEMICFSLQKPYVQEDWAQGSFIIIEDSGGDDNSGELKHEGSGNIIGGKKRFAYKKGLLHYMREIAAQIALLESQ